MNNNITIWSRNFVLLCLSTFLMAIAFYFLIPTLPIYITEIIKANKREVGIILATYTISALIIRPFIGFAIDKYGRKIIYIASFALFTALFYLYSYTATIISILILRFLHGLTWGATSTTSSTLVVDMIPAQKRGEGIGIYGLAMTSAMAVGPVIGLSIASKVNFNTLFFIGLILCMCGLIITLLIKYPKFTASSTAKKFQWKNLIQKKSLPISLNLLVLQITYGGLLSFVALYGKELGIKNPGIFFLIYAVGIAISRIFSGKIFDKNGPKKIIIVAMILLTVGFIILSIIQNLTGFLVSAFILGLGNGIVMPTYQAMVNNIVDKSQRGSANSTLFTALDLGIGIGMILTGTLSEIISIANAYLISSFISILSLFLFLLFVIKHYNKNRIL